MKPAIQTGGLSMNAVTTLFPVFFMLGLGFFSHRCGWISPAQKDGANAVVFHILFPLLIFRLMAEASVDTSDIPIVIYVFLCFCAAWLIGKLATGFTGRRFAHISPYLLTVTEGGNVALPLYLSIVGTSSNTVLFDIAGSVMCFIVFPVLVTRQTADGTSFKEITHSICRNSFVIAVFSGLTLNLTGLYDLILSTPVGLAAEAALETASSPIVPMILFILGYNLKTENSMVRPVLRLILVKSAIAALIISGFFLFFPDSMHDPAFRLAPLIYFTSPTGFGLIPVITPLFEDADDLSYTGAFISTYLIITLVVYTAAAILYV